MDFNKLSANEKMAAIGSAALVIGGLAGYSYSVTVLAVLFAVGLLAVIFLPQLSPSTALPGSKGSLMLITGGVAGVLMVLSLVVALGVVFIAFGIRDALFLIAVAGGVVAAWASWQEFQAEGGTFKVGTSAPSGATGAPSAASGPTAAAPPPPPAASQEPRRDDSPPGA